MCIKTRDSTSTGVQLIFPGWAQAFCDHEVPVEGRLAHHKSSGSTATQLVGAIRVEASSVALVLGEGQNLQAMGSRTALKSTWERENPNNSQFSCPRPLPKFARVQPKVPFLDYRA